MKQRLPLLLALPGCGALVFWQLGVLKGLNQYIDITRTPMLASSSGSVASVLAACGVDFDATAKRAVELTSSAPEGRNFGMIGQLGPIVRQLLQEQLPEDAHLRCSNIATLLVTTLPFFKPVPVHTFKNKDDVINVVLASAHIPLLLDWKWTKVCRQKRCIDGGFWWWLHRSEHEYKPLHVDQALVIKHSEDKHLMDNMDTFDRWKPSSIEVVRELMHRGTLFADTLAERLPLLVNDPPAARSS